MLATESVVSGQCRDRAIAAGDIEHPAFSRQFPEFLSPEITDDAVVVVGLAGSECRDESLFPEPRPLVEFFLFCANDCLPVSIANRRDCTSVSEYVRECQVSRVSCGELQLIIEVPVHRNFG